MRRNDANSPNFPSPNSRPNRPNNPNNHDISERLRLANEEADRQMREAANSGSPNILDILNNSNNPK